MSGRSSRRASALVALVSVGACHKNPREADPEKIVALAKNLVNTSPPLAGARMCVEADYANPAITVRTALQLAKQTVPDAPEYQDWINPPIADAPAFRTVLEGKDELARRRAAAQLLRAKGYMMYRVDMVNVPMAIGFKELKRGAVGVRALGYDHIGNIKCVRQFIVQNDKALSEAAMKASDKPTIDPAISKKLRDDLTEQMKEQISELMGGG